MIVLDKETYTIREVAATIGVSYLTVHKWAHDGKLAHYCMGRTRKVSKADFEGFLAQSYHPVASEYT